MPIPVPLPRSCSSNAFAASKRLRALISDHFIASQYFFVFFRLLSLASERFLNCALNLSVSPFHLLERDQWCFVLWVNCLFDSSSIETLLCHVLHGLADAPQGQPRGPSFSHSFTASLLLCCHHYFTLSYFSHLIGSFLVSCSFDILQCKCSAFDSCCARCSSFSSIIPVLVKVVNGM